MNSLKMYYSNTKNHLCQEQLVLVFHPPVFILNVHNSIHPQKADNIVLFFFIPRYYFIIHEIISSKKHVYVETNARGPPLKEV